MIIHLAGPLDLEATLESGQAFRWRRRGAWFEGVLGSSVVSLRMAPGGLEFLSEPVPEPQVLPILADYLALDEDLEAIYESIGTDEVVSASIARYRGMRVLRQDPWECLASFICSSNSNLPRIQSNIEAIARLCGDPIGARGHSRHAFPSPEQLASAGPAPLRRLKLGYRAEYLHQAAVAVAEGRVSPWALRETAYEEALDRLLDVPGVGDKVANCALLFSMDKPGAFPVDVWVHRALEEIYPLEIRAFRRRLMRRAGPGRPRPGRRRDGAIIARDRLRQWGQERFGRYAGWANHYLFHDRRNRP